MSTGMDDLRRIVLDAQILKRLDVLEERLGKLEEPQRAESPNRFRKRHGETRQGQVSQSTEIAPAATDGRCDICGEAGPGHPAFDGGAWLDGWRVAGDHMQHRCEGVDPHCGHPGRAAFYEGRHPFEPAPAAPEREQREEPIDYVLRAAMEHSCDDDLARERRVAARHREALERLANWSLTARKALAYDGEPEPEESSHE